ncbi:acyl-CoA dehydrogenase [Glutamicibacter halophytocola]|uniref:Acyl-CoA dehydrogenase n=1 Tax=Glutamicibacter halophytocola TaxID=1933880 RepID=A0ABX5Y9M2_9MICC|nr:acyl-CoA dehydrogenase family protein [Glutamicibacter halophytocola]ALG30099.1 acyl-CoA dehydrogenase [Glutamicibacter halophytocola]MBF6670726.1 acyl-CoA dehydrogenase family protein [Glutamicibacter sp. FBE19]QDY66376.1 acyl-CoA dehydrogenase [Glutamicibacter halophytocola]
MFEISEDQKSLIGMVHDFAETKIAPMAQKWDEEQHFPIDVLAQAGQLGMGGIYASEEHGGSALTRSDAVLVFEELAKADPTLAAYISIHNMVVWMVDSFGNEKQRAAWLPELISMEQLGSYCLTEPGIGSDAAALSTRARRDGDEYVLSGVKQFISGAGSSGLYIVMARTADTGARGISAFLVPADLPGLGFGANEKKMGWKAQPTRQVIMEGVRIPAENLLGEEGQGFSMAMKALNGGRLNIAACSLGGGQLALDKSAAYLKERQAFGGPLAKQEALVFKLADMDMELEAARSLLRRAASALDAKSPDTVRLCAMAKKVATDAGFNVANSAIQLHGGYGYLADYGMEKIFRDLRVHQILEGTNEIMSLIVGRILLED